VPSCLYIGVRICSLRDTTKISEKNAVVYNDLLLQRIDTDWLFRSYFEDILGYNLILWVKLTVVADVCNYGSRDH